MKKAMVMLTVLVLSVVFLVGTASADTEHLISLQGSATDDQGDPVASADIRVRIYDAATGGSLVYDSVADFNNVTDSDGVFDVLLGSGVDLDLDNTVKYYMEVDIDTEEVVGDATGGRQEFWPGSGDHINLQKRVTASCAGQVMVAINEDGSAVCETDDEGTPGITSCTECDATFVNESQANSITSAMVVDGTIGYADIGSNAVRASNIAAGEVGASEIATGAVSSSEIADGQVTSADLFGTNCSDICIDAVGTGDITAVNQGEGTQGGGSSGSVTIAFDCSEVMGAGVRCDGEDINVYSLSAADGSPDNALYVDADGDVGIGTTAPNSDLSIVGNGSSTYALYAYDTSHTTAHALNNATTGLGRAFYGRAQGIGGDDHYGGYFIGNGATTNYGVYGWGADYGVYGYSYDYALYGEGGTYGVYGDGTTYGVYGTGDLYAGYFSSSDTNGTGFGVQGRATESGGSHHYGGYFIASGATNNYGVYGVGDYVGGHFINDDTTGNDYGVRGSAYGSGGDSHYGGQFEASGGTTNYGVYGSADDYGVYGDGTSYGVYGNGDLYGGYFKNSDTSGTEYGIRATANGSGGTTHYGAYISASGATSNNFAVYGYATGTNGVGVRGYGSTYDFDAIGPGVNYGSTSSIRWKRNVTEIDNALNQVLNLRGVYFDWDEEHGGQHDMGMIAEEVGEIVPEVVVYEKDGEYASGMDYGALTPLLVQAIKELKEENNQLKELVCLDHPNAEVCE